MPFDVKKFEKAKFEDRTKSVSVPDLAEWFDEGEAPEIVVRGLTGAEIALTHEAAARNKNIQGLMEAIASSDSSEKIDAIKSSLGIDSDSPEELARRVEQLRLGAVDPEFDQMQAAKFFECYPVEAYQLTNEINRLTGKGRLPGESKPSGKKQKSKTQ